MLLTISTTHQPATDLGYLLHKDPSKCQTFEESFGKMQPSQYGLLESSQNATGN
jgi:hypothetical protein